MFIRISSHTVDLRYIPIYPHVVYHTYLDLHIPTFDAVGAFSRHFSRRDRKRSVGVAASGSTRKWSATNARENDDEQTRTTEWEKQGKRKRKREKSLSMNSWRPSAWAYLRDRTDCLRAVACVYPVRGYFHVPRLAMGSSSICIYEFYSYSVTKVRCTGFEY